MPAGGAAPNEDGSAPEGFEIKGNADSMLYHVPGSRFYDQTVAEVWFATAEDAEAAGYELPRASATTTSRPTSRRSPTPTNRRAPRTTDEQTTQAAGERQRRAAGGEGSASDEPQSDRGESEADAEEDN